MAERVGHAGQPSMMNSQITDSVTQTNIAVLGTSPAQAMGTLYLTAGQAHGAIMQNAVTNQRHGQTIDLATLTQSINLLLTAPPAASARSTVDILTNTRTSQSLSALQAVKGAFGGRRKP